MKAVGRGARIALGLALFAAAAVLLALALRPYWDAPEPVPTPSASAIPSPAPSVSAAPSPEPSGEELVDGLPVGRLVRTAERKAYEDGSLTLYIPKLKVTRTVRDGTDDATLDRGVGLYEFAQLPGEGNRNVSLAGHRNGISNGKITDRAPFYYIDTLGEGDYLYLYDSAHIYRYVYEYTEIVESDDWDPIRTAGYGCLTITSCHPIGVSDHRIVVRAKLDEILPYDKDYGYPAASEEVTK